jgi:hypothetical protein
MIKKYNIKIRKFIDGSWKIFTIEVKMTPHGRDLSVIDVKVDHKISDVSPTINKYTATHTHSSTRSTIKSAIRTTSFIPAIGYVLPTTESDKDRGVLYDKAHRSNKQLERMALDIFRCPNCHNYLIKGAHCRVCG